MLAQRYALGIEYDGSRFYGWQNQRQSPTVQAVLEAALSQVAAEPLAVTAAGRTDRGVHALCQVVHFDSGARRSARAWVLGLNSHLPDPAAARWLRPVGDDFHARYSAEARTYRYRIVNRWTRPALDRHRAAWVYRPLDALLMHEAAQCLAGEHDFSSFRAAGCQSHHARRRLETIAVQRQGDEVWIEVTANAFVYHMVRNIAGALIAVGHGARPASWIAELLDARDRRLGGVTAPAAGLYFVGPRYAAHWHLPVGADPAFPGWNES